MGNAQEKPPGSGGGGGRPDRTTAGSGTRSRDGGGSEKPQTRRAPEKGVANGRETSPAGRQEEQVSPAADTSYLDAPAGALPPHLARLKNEGNHLFKHGQFGDALEKYTQAIDGCAEAGEQNMIRSLRIYVMISIYSKRNSCVDYTDSSQHLLSLIMYT